MKIESQELLCEQKQLEKSNFKVEDLLDFSNEEIKGTLEIINGSGGSSVITPLNGSNSSISPSDLSLLPDFGCEDSQFSEDLCVPNDDIAELEWLSNFVEDSFSGQDLQRLQLLSGKKHQPTDSGSETRTNRPGPLPKPAKRPLPKPPLPGKARSKRPRAIASNWKSRALRLSPSSSNSSSDTDKDRNGGRDGGGERRCFHCAADKTPQWRTGPMGPKTLCNACGVRYKSGRLVPEYRPAASPSFTMAKHSNSHRKVMELRRQKELKENRMILHPSVMVGRSHGGDYLIQQRVGSDFRQVI